MSAKLDRKNQLQYKVLGKRERKFVRWSRRNIFILLVTFHRNFLIEIRITYIYSYDITQMKDVESYDCITEYSWIISIKYFISDFCYSLNNYILFQTMDCNYIIPYHHLSSTFVTCLYSPFDFQRNDLNSIYEKNIKQVRTSSWF